MAETPSPQTDPRKVCAGLIVIALAEQGIPTAFAGKGGF